MVGAPKGNTNALKHGQYAKQASPVSAQDPKLRKATFAIAQLEEAIDAICEHMEGAEGSDFTKLVNALSLATTALFNGHRTVSFLTGGVTPMEDALKELKKLKFEDD